MDKHLFRLKAEMGKKQGMADAHLIRKGCVSYKETFTFSFYNSNQIDFRIS